MLALSHMYVPVRSTARRAMPPQARNTQSGVTQRAWGRQHWSFFNTYHTLEALFYPSHTYVRPQHTITNPRAILLLPTINSAPYVGSHRQQSQAQHTRGHTQSALYARNHQTVQTLQHAAPHMQVCAGSWQQNMPGAPCSHVPLAGH